MKQYRLADALKEIDVALYGRDCKMLPDLEGNLEVDIKSRWRKAQIYLEMGEYDKADIEAKETMQQIGGKNGEHYKERLWNLMREI